MVREEKARKRAHPCPHCLPKVSMPSERDVHVRAVREKFLST